MNYDPNELCLALHKKRKKRKNKIKKNETQAANLKVETCITWEQGKESKAFSFSLP